MILILFYRNPIKAKTVLFEIFWDIFCQSSALVNDGFFRKQLFNRLDFSRFLLFSTFSVARCQGPQNSVWTPVLNTRMHFIHCFDYSRPFLCSRNWIHIDTVQFISFIYEYIFPFCKRVFFANIQNWPDRVTNILDY